MSGSAVVTDAPDAEFGRIFGGVRAIAAGWHAVQPLGHRRVVRPRRCRGSAAGFPTGQFLVRCIL
jgi:hypothetical protein